MMYAQNTSVPVDRSRAEIEKLVTKYGAEQFYSGWDATSAKIGFRMKNRFVQFYLPLMPPTSKHKMSQDRRDQLVRSRWRALVLVLKAKLEAVEAGISDFETEFLGNVLVGEGQILADLVKPKLEEAYASGKPLALPSGLGA